VPVVTRHTYDNAEITIGGVPLPKPGRVFIVHGRLEGPPEPLPDFVPGNFSVKPYEFEATMKLVDAGDELDELAWQAVCTPSLGASSALDVLIDARLARGELDSPLQAFFTPEAWARRRREAAFEWAQDRTGGPFFRVLRAMEEVASLMLTPPQMPSIETVSGEHLDSIAGHLFGLYRNESGYSEPDEELRARCLARLREMQR
jgi:hypothetical protein